MFLIFLFSPVALASAIIFIENCHCGAAASRQRAKQRLVHVALHEWLTLHDSARARIRPKGYSLQTGLQSITLLNQYISARARLKLGRSPRSRVASRQGARSASHWVNVGYAGLTIHHHDPTYLDPPVLQRLSRQLERLGRVLLNAKPVNPVARLTCSRSSRVARRCGLPMQALPNVVRPCCREAAALRGARHAKRGGAARLPFFNFFEMGHNVRQCRLY